MAQQAVKNAVETPAKRARAPRVGHGSRDDRGPVAVAPVDYSRYGLTFTDSVAFMQFARGYPNTEGITLFLYRLIPKIDLMMIGRRERNIQKGGYEDLDLYSLESVAKNFGRGKYQVKMTDSNRIQGQREVVRSFIFEVTDTDKPPVYDLRTLELNHSDNQDEVNRLIVQGVLVRDPSNGAPRLRTTADSMPVMTPPPGAAGVGDLNAASLLMQIALESFKTSRQSPSEAVKDVIGIAQLLRPEKTETPSIDQIADAVVAKLGGAVPGRGAALDPFATYEKVQSFIERAAGQVIAQVNPAAAAAAPAAGDGGSSWAPHVGPIISEVRKFWPEVLAGLRMLKAERGATAAAPAAETQGEVVLEALPLLPLNERIETIFKAGFNSMRQGITGTQFAEWVCGEMPGGLEAFDFLKPQGVQGLLTMAAMHPQGRVVVNDGALRPQLEKFLSEFFAFPAAAAA